MKSLPQLPTSFNFLVTAQSLGALNDNLFKLLVVFQLILIKGIDQVIHISAMAGILFVAPFIVFSPLSGMLADRYNKLTIFKIAKIAEIGIMLLGTLFFFLQNETGLYLTLFLMSLQSTVIGPAKNGVLPELVGTSQVTRANGVMVATCYAAIIAGTVLAAAISTITAGKYGIAGIACLLFAIAGAVAAMAIRATDSINQTISPCTYRDALMSVKKSPALLAAMLGSALFLFIGAFVQIAIIPFGMQVLNLSREYSSYLFLFAALGIGTGAFIAGKCSRRRPNLGLLSIGSGGIAISSLLMLKLGSDPITASILMTLLGCFGGIFIIPINTFIQLCVSNDRRGKILGLSYLLNFSFILAAAGMVEMTSKINVTAHLLFSVPMIVGIILFIGSILVTPRSLIRTIVTLFVRTKYDLRLHAINNMPSEGAAIVAFNHISWIDGLIAMAAIDRPIHFFMKRGIFNTTLLRPLFKLCGIYPIACSDGAHSLNKTFDHAQEILEKGGCIGIFPEGAISHTGFLQQCKGGYQKMALPCNAPIIPAYINGLWGSAFSYYGGKLFSSLQLFSRRNISVTFGKPLPSTTPPKELRSSIEMYGAEAAKLDQDRSINLTSSFIHNARRNWHHEAMYDTTGKKVTFFRTLVAATVVSDTFRKMFPVQKNIGIMLPASVGGSIVNIATVLCGKISVNLNFTGSDSSIINSVRQCNLNAVITSKLFLTKLGRQSLQLPFVFIEDILKNISLTDRIRAILKALFIPAQLYGLSPTKADDCATIIFSSGSSAEPKGIMLSHGNILANTNSMHQAIFTSKKDAICAALPLFHSFGITATLWFPMLYGFKACYHPNPLDGEAISKLVDNQKATILLATPTFLKTYLRKATTEAFASLRLVVTGAEKLRASLADDFYKKFNIMPLEGYGATELSPVVSLNVPDVDSHGRTGKGSKTGTVGRPLPGIAVKLIDPETGAATKKDQGLLCVKGMNVMAGYLGNPNATRTAIVDGWYSTGDIASIDEEGFITLHDRLSRFSKLGGEMVSHGAIEEVINLVLNSEEPCIAVTSVNDMKKGERIVLVYTDAAGTKELLSSLVRKANIPNLWKPSLDCYIPIKAIPVLGTGKIDLKGIKEHATSYFSNSSLKMAA